MKVRIPFKFITLILFLFSNEIKAQKDVTTFGFVMKPIFSSKYFRTGPTDIADNGINFNLAQQSGFSAGGVLRWGLTKSLSFETGINYVKRNYQLKITDSTSTRKSDFKIVGYEVPLQALIFIQLSEDIWMNAALGPSIDMFPSDVSTSDDYFAQQSIRNSNTGVFNLGIIANLGWEWRTKKNGYIYLGACYHRSFNDTYTTTIGYINDPKAKEPYAQVQTGLTGDYLTFDIRYYFHEDPEKKAKKKK